MDKFNLSTLDADTVFSQFKDTDNYYNLFPNLPSIKMMVKPWEVQSNRIWIITKDIPSSIFDNLEQKDLVPFEGYGDTYPHFENIYYNQRRYA